MTSLNWQPDKLGCTGRAGGNALLASARLILAPKRISTGTFTAAAERFFIFIRHISPAYAWFTSVQRHKMRYPHAGEGCGRHGL
jgi:hypothetical protein